MEVIKAFLGCSCRRRTLFHKVLPLALQVFVVVGVWHIIKSQMQVPKESEDSSGTKSLRSANQPMCSPGEYSKGERFQLDSIISHSNLVPASPGQKQIQRHILSVEILVRNTEQGSLVLYPIGTPVLYGGNKDGEVDNNDNPVMYSENEENPGNIIIAQGNENALLQEDDGTNNKLANFLSQDGNDKKQVVLDYGPENVQDYPQLGNERGGDQENVQDYPQLGHDGGGDQQILNDMLVKDQMIPIKSGENVQQNPNQLDENKNVQSGPDNTIFQDEQNPNAQYRQQPEARPPSVLNPQPREALDTKLGQAPADQPQGQQLFDNFKQENVKVSMTRNDGPENGVKFQSLLFQPSQEESSQEGVQSFKAVEVQLDQRHVFSPNNAQIGLTHDQEIGNQDKSIHHGFHDSAFLDGGTDPLYTDGFSERVKKFKSELYGKVPEDDSHEMKSPSFYPLNNPNTCSGVEKIDLLYLINSYPQNSESRKRIRETFVDSVNFKSFKISHMFLVGHTMTPSVQNNLMQEQQNYRDILQGEFLDTPGNRTLKGLMGLRWVSQFCRYAKFVMKIEDEVFVDTDKLLRGLIPVANKTVGKKAMLCSFNPQGPIPRTGPNAISEDLFPSRTNLRPYCKGYAILMTQGVIPSLLAAAEHVPVFHADDLYLYGILPFVAGGIEVYDVGNKRAFHDFGIEMLSCYRDQKDKCTFVASRAYGERFSALWNLVKERLLDSMANWENEQSLWNVKSFKRNF